jgi:hypothetical protein
MAEAVKTFKDVTFEWYGTVDTPVSIYTDMPGGAMAYRLSVTLGAVTSRTEMTFPLDLAGDLYGKLIQFRAQPSSSAGFCILYGGKIRFRPIGVYLDGARADKWESQPLNLGG